MSSTHMSSRSTKATLKKRHAPVLQRAKPCLIRKSGRRFCHEAGAGRIPHMAFLTCHAILPEATPIFS
eukprot:776161-Alexandrium_andersonii.AAC.1